jgi:diaminopimelate decarboxylase
MEFIDRVLHLGGVPAATLAEQFGTPLYVYETATIRRQMERIRNAFRSLPFRPFYAMKANGNVALLRVIREEGFGCDAVSPGEIFLAMRAGFAPEDIWFTCSNVSDDDLRAVPDRRIVINVNSMSEIDRVLALELRNPIAIRVNPDVGAGHHHDVITAGEGVKFGIDAAELEAARMVIEDSERRVVGLHAHIGSGVDEIEPLLASAKRLLELSAHFHSLRWVNFGGGMSVPYRPEDPEFPVQEYGSALAGLAGDFMRRRGLTAILEPGRYVVAQSGTLVARITSKRISAGVEWVGCDTGFNHLVRPSKYGAYHHIVNASNGSAGSLRQSFDASLPRNPVVVAGNLCESGDVFTRDAGGRPIPRPIDPFRIGDLIAFCDTGAYGFSMASHYNARLLPPEVLVDQSKAQLIRARQPIEDLVRGQE